MSADLLKNSIQNHLKATLPGTYSTFELTGIGGGSVNNCYKISNSGKSYFLKTNSASRFPQLFEKEEAALHFLRSQHIIRIPAVIIRNEINDWQILILEWINATKPTPLFWKRFGEKLAQLHQVTNNHFGFTENNYMGALPQKNTLQMNWSDFFILHRLHPQIKTAADNKMISPSITVAFEKLYQIIPAVFNKEEPSLLHGDLWYGNILCDEEEQHVLIDPAVYFGHRSMDLAMTTLFGGFDKTFYDAYHYHFPLPTNYREQWQIANLYPLLIHLNLFGISYLQDIEVILKKFTR